jgi:hypothetical protein
MEATIDIEFVQGRDEQVIKELAIVSDDVVQTFLFLAPYPMESHGSKESGLNSSDGRSHMNGYPRSFLKHLPLMIISMPGVIRNVNYSTTSYKNLYTTMKTSNVPTPGS